MTVSPVGKTLHDLGDIRKLQSRLLNSLQRLQDYATRLDLTDEAHLLSETIGRLQSDSFTIAVVGEFKRGKSTFINALLGRDVLPTDVLPTTATLNRVVYGLHPSVTIHFKDGHTEEADVENLGAYVTKLTADARTRAASIEEAVVRLPVPYLRNNVEIIDTPGLNDEDNMDLVTRSVIPHVDAAILVITPQAPLSQYETEFVENTLLTSDLGRVLFVLTRIDSLEGPDEVARMIAFIQDRVREKLQHHAAETYGVDSAAYQAVLRKIGDPKVFGVAGKLALAGKVTNDAAKLSASQFPEFEAALEHFLSEERGPIVLQVPINRVLSAAPRILTAIGAQQATLHQARAALIAPYENGRRVQDEVRRDVEATSVRLEQFGPALDAAVNPLLATLPAALDQAINALVDNMQVTPVDLQQHFEAVRIAVDQALVSAIYEASQRWLAQVRYTISLHLHEEATRLRSLAQMVDARFGDPTGLLAAPVFAPGDQLEMSVVNIANMISAQLAGAPPNGAPGVPPARKGWAVSGLVERAADATGWLDNLPGIRGSSAERLVGSGVVKSFRELKRRQYRDAVSRAMQAVPLGQQIQAEIPGACAALAQAFRTHVSPAISQSLANMAQYRARRETEIDLKLEQLAEIHSATSELHRDALHWIAVFTQSRD